MKRFACLLLCLALCCALSACWITEPDEPATTATSVEKSTTAEESTAPPIAAGDITWRVLDFENNEQDAESKDWLDAWCYQHLNGGQTADNAKMEEDIAKAAALMAGIPYEPEDDIIWYAGLTGDERYYVVLDNSFDLQIFDLEKQSQALRLRFDELGIVHEIFGSEYSLERCIIRDDRTVYWFDGGWGWSGNDLYADYVVEVKLP